MKSFSEFISTHINEWRNHVTIGIAILLVYNLESTNIHASVDKGLVIVDTRS